jgi:2-polyprenyl-3-methyl-5-hydroxy-6-metoxy-1,4-benzoquinol methylase
MKNEIKCVVCGSNNGCILNTYKHYCFVCNDCNSVTHEKKKKYALDYILPKFIFSKILPRKAYLRLFSDSQSVASAFYDVYSEECMDINEWRKSEIVQIIDELNLAGIQLSQDISILDVSGGPGYIGHQLKKACKRVVVTEFSNKSSKKMAEQFGIETATFDYDKDKIENVVSGKFDVILIRSSIIYCDDLNGFIEGMTKLLNPKGHVLIQSILPTYGEVFWWQQLEHKFPVIYSQESIEKLFYKNNFQLKAGFRDYGSYFGVKNRSYNQISKRFFTWALEFPMIIIYLLINAFKKASIDQSMNHKMITQIWEFASHKTTTQNVKYKNYQQGGRFKSKTFGYKYNGYLKE